MRLVTYSASAHRLFGLGKLKPGKEWVKKRQLPASEGRLEIRGLSEDEGQEMPSILSQQHTREVAARGDTAGAYVVTFCLTTLGQQ